MKNIFSFLLIATFALTATADDLEVIITPATGGPGTGAIDLTITGGVAPYTVNWAGPGSFSASTEDISGLDTGYYVVTVGDNYCGEATRTVHVTSTVSGINEVSQIKDLSIFPNPTSDQLNIHFESDYIGEATITILGVWGGLLYEATVSVEASNQLQFDFNQKTAGLYFLSIRNEEGILLSEQIVLDN